MWYLAFGASAFLALHKRAVAAVCRNNGRGWIDRWAAAARSTGIAGTQRVTFARAHSAVSFAERPNFL
eukprot:COSAG03_NODE_9361_length_726_cov_1.151515_1_plen_67_part_10